MANSKIRGITIEIGGDTTKLDKALGSVDKKVKGTQVELREVNKLLKIDPTNTEMLAQKQALLTDAISETKEKLDILKNAESQVQEQFKKGEVSEEQYKALKRELGRTEVELANLEEAARQTDTAIEELGKSSKLSGEELKEAEEKAGDFKETLGDLGGKAETAAKALGAGFVAAATYATKFETDCDKALNTVITQTGAADTEVEGLEETLLSIYKDNFGEDINDIALAMSAVKQQTGQTGKELKNTTENAILMRDTFDIDVNESIRGVNAMMKQFGISSEEAYNLLAQGAQKGLNQNGDLADQLAEYSVYYADMGLSAEEAFNMIANGAKNGTFQIDYLNDAVKEFGIRAKDGTSDEAFKQLGLDVDDLKTKFAQGGEGAKEAFKTVNEALFSCDDEVQRNLLGVAMYGTKWEDLGEDAIRALVDTQGEISATNDALGTINENKYNDLGNQIEELGRNLKTDLVKPIGEELKPVISDVIKEVKGKIPEVKTLVLAVVSKVKDFISFMSRNGTQIISIIAGIAAGMLAWNVVTMIQGLVAAIKVWKATTEGVTIAQKILNTVMAANPIGIVITVVAALVAALVTLFATNEDFRNKVIAVWEAVKEAASKVFGAIADFFTVTIPNAFNGFINFIKSNWQALLLLIVNPFAGAFKLLYDNCGAFREFVDNFVQNIKQFFQNLWNGIVSIFQGVGQWFIARFTEAYNGVTGVFAAIGQWFGARWQDIKNALATVASWFLTMFTNAYTNVKNVFANVFSAIGSWFGARWTEIKTALSAVPSWFGTQFQNAWTNIKNAFANVTSFFSGLWEKIKGCFVNVGVKIGSAVGDAFKSAINSCLSTIEGVVNKFIGMINGVIDVINEIPGVSLGKIGTLSLPRLAKGGVLKEGTAMVAEAGPELLSMVNGKAVVTPLSGSAKNQAMENAGKGGGGYVQNVNITSPKALSPYEIARQTRLQTRSMILAVQRG
ncbi:MAG: phage tail tape measure protein [Roseburia hominis]|uniref:phage tail tape measure protein n=1 Tax=Roseburia hominis TaxID=301301 RepID=UPI002914EA06|nr:phage tail tape measure protein [Roseburia hominis]MDU6921881.1 phage tail tape measure protein [Roseburia hominis]